MKFTGYILLCLCLSVPVSASLYVCMCTQAFHVQKLVAGIFFNYSALHFLSQYLLLSQKPGTCFHKKY